jgi:paraquat-inducible protein B
LAGWLVWQHVLERGVAVNVTFKTADSVAADKTEVRCRSVKVGMVESAKISEDLSHVIIGLRIDRDESKLLRGGTRFWVVRPRISAQDVSGLSTLFTGAYIELDPGEGAPDAREFTGLEEPPATSSSVPGLRLSLTAEDAGSLSIGSPVYFKGYEVGHVELRTFVLKDQRTRYDIFIEKDFASLVHEGTCFWNTSGIDVSAGADGVHVRTPSLQAIISGSVTFGLPPDAVAGNEAVNGSVFKLFKDEAAARDSVFHPEKKILLLFNQSVRGLTKGAPVEFRGLSLGRVADVSFKYAPEGEKRVPVLIEIDPKLLRAAVQDRDDEKNYLATAVRHGLRAKLATGSLITGALYVDIDFVSNAAPAELWHYGMYDVLPTVPAGLMQIEEKVNAILAKIEALPLEETLNKFGNTATSITDTANEAKAALEKIRQLVAKDETQKLPADLDTTLEQVRSAVSSLGPNGAVQGDLRRSLDELRAALRSLKTLSDSIEQKPNSLIFGNDKTGNPVPRARRP